MPARLYCTKQTGPILSQMQYKLCQFSTKYISVQPGDVVFYRKAAWVRLHFRNIDLIFVILNILSYPWAQVFLCGSRTISIPPELDQLLFCSCRSRVKQDREGCNHALQQVGLFQFYILYFFSVNNVQTWNHFSCRCAVKPNSIGPRIHFSRNSINDQIPNNNCH